MNRFTYFDFIAHIVPGALLFLAISTLIEYKNLPLTTGNPAIDTLLFLIFSFAVGALFHQLSKHSIEPLVKRLFWHGKFYSEIYLVKRYGLCQDPVRAQILSTAVSFFQFNKRSISCLNADAGDKCFADPNKVSHQVFRRFDTYTMDHGLAKKGHLANALYSLYRNMTLTAFVVGVLFGTNYKLGTFPVQPNLNLALTISSFIASFIFLIRTRNEGERYVQGVFSSISRQQVSTM